MELKIFTPENKETGKKKMPKQFEEEIRPDLIKRAVQAIASHKRQRYGSDPRAGKKHSADLSKRRRKYRGCYGHGISRVPRKIMSRRGTQFNWTGAIIPGAVGGRRAHPPKAEKIITQKINDKERKKAIRSALSASITKDIVEKRGHSIPTTYPFLISKDFEAMDKTKKVVIALNTLGLEKDIERGSKKKVRAGKGKARGRKYKTSKGPLLVVSQDCKLLKTAKNIPGIDVVEIKNINAELLAPGTMPGRLTLFTEDAINKLEKERLFS